MSVGQLAALASRHLIAVGLILLVATGISVGLSFAAADYSETGTIALETKGFVEVEPLSVDQNYLLNKSLIFTCQMLVMRLSGPEGENRLRQAGSNGKFDITVVNDSNADTPEYPYPHLTVSVTDNSAARTQHDFVVAMKVVADEVGKLRVDDKVSPQDRLAIYTLSDSGPISQRGSLARTYVSLIFLTLVATYLACRFLDRRTRSVGSMAWR